MDKGRAPSALKLCALHNILFFAFILSGCNGATAPREPANTDIIEISSSPDISYAFITHHFEYSEIGFLLYIRYNSQGEILSGTTSKIQLNPDFNLLEKGCLPAYPAHSDSAMKGIPTAKLSRTRVNGSGDITTLHCNFDFDVFQRWLKSKNAIGGILNSATQIAAGTYLKAEPYDGEASIDFHLQNSEKFLPILNSISAPYHFKRIEKAVTLSLLNKENDSVYFVQHQDRVYVLFKFEYR